MERAEKWAMLYKNKIIPIGDETIKWIRQDPTEIWGWFDLELMLAWKNMFPLTEESREMGYLPLMNKAWELTLNPWWRFVTDIPASLAPPPSSSSSPETGSSMQLSERSLTETEKGWMDSVISVKKILQDKPVECFMKGSLHKMKMI